MDMPLRHDELDMLSPNVLEDLLEVAGRELLGASPRMIGPACEVFVNVRGGDVKKP